MRYLFLDIDGVANTHKDFHSADEHTCVCSKRSNARLNLLLLDNLKAFVSLSKAEVILCSSWRFSPIMVEFFVEHSGLTITDQTPAFLSSSKGHEITRYLKDHPKVKDYLILEDDPSLIFFENLVPHWIKIKEGFTQEVLGKALDYWDLR
jgi:hypothetical protein